MRLIRDSSLYIAFSSEILGEDSKIYIDGIVDSVFGESARKKSEVSTTIANEIVYELDNPIFDDNQLFREFYENLDVLFEELKDYNPHFTEFKINN